MYDMKYINKTQIVNIYHHTMDFYEIPVDIRAIYTKNYVNITGIS